MMHCFYLQNQNMEPASFRILSSAVRRHLSLRNLTLSETDGDYTVTLTVDPSLQNDRFVIRIGDHRADLTAANSCALHAAFGKLLRESHFNGRGDFMPPKAGTIIDFTPKSPLRGMYFATHFSNFYHVAPLTEIYEVIEDLALRGCNSLLVWFDMHHFTSMEDPAAQDMVARLRAILAYAAEIGMDNSLTMLSNEAFSSSPEHLRAEWTPQNGYLAPLVGHFHVEICPSKEGGIEEILKARREMLLAFRDLPIKYVIYWPYDQGGCTCKACTPWATNGYLRLFPYFKDLVHEIFPKTEIIVSTWFFDRFTSGEWDGFYPKMKDPIFSDVPYFLSFFENGVLPDVILKNGIPDGVRLIDFPEISMYSCSPWGGYGASHLAAFLKRTNAASSHLYSGAFPYSEGIYEDANKFIQLSYYSGEYEDPFEALRAYVRYEFCCDDDALYEAIKRTETGLGRRRAKPDAYIQTTIIDKSDVTFVWETLARYQKILPEQIAASAKFRLFYLRALIDAEIVSCDGYAIHSPRCQEALREVCEIYHTTNETHPWLKPPVGV